MIIRKLELHNFGVYASTNTFSMHGDKPIVLIGGMNGHGKTTFLEAVLIALYGSNSSAYNESKYNTYGQYLKSYVNTSDGTLLSYIDLEFTLEEKDVHIYRVHREWSGAKQRVAESISVFQDGVFNHFLTDNWNMFIESILPSGLSSFFFFDGEKIADLAVENTSAQMKESIKSLLGISVLDSLESDLKRIISRVSKYSSSEQTSAEIGQLRQAKENATRELAALDLRIAELATQKRKLSQKLENKKQAYSAKGGDIVSQRQELFQARIEAISAANTIREQLIEDAGSELPLTLTVDLLQSMLCKAEAAHNQKQLRVTLEKLRLLLPGYALENPNANKSALEFISYVERCVRESDGKSEINLSDTSILSLQALIASRLRQNSKAVSERMTHYSELQNKIAQLDNYLSVDIDEKAIARLYKSIKETEQEIIRIDVEMAKLADERSALNGRVITATASFSRQVEEYLRRLELNDGNERTIKYAHMAEKIIDAYRIRLQTQKTDRVARTMTECYKTLASKTSLIDSVQMDGDTLDIHYISCDGKEVSKESLSAGEKQLMVISLLWALARCSKRKLPVIIDTPLSRLDSAHRASLITHYFPNASDQAIILSTDSEIDDQYYCMMKENIGDEFTLAYDDENKSTTIQRGYFVEETNDSSSN